jgi:hypothetical protein
MAWCIGTPWESGGINKKKQPRDKEGDGNNKVIRHAGVSSANLPDPLRLHVMHDTM